MGVPIALPTILTQSVCPLFAHGLFLMWAENVGTCGHKKERENNSTLFIVLKHIMQCIIALFC